MYFTQDFYFSFLTDNSDKKKVMRILNQVILIKLTGYRLTVQLYLLWTMMFK